MRASVIQGNLTDLQRLDPEPLQDILGGVSPKIVEAIERASRLAWLPLQHDVELSMSVARVLGDQGCVDWARTSMLLSLRTPLLEPLWKAAFRVFGMSPGALFRAAPSGWKAVYRNVGGVEHQARPNAAVLALFDLPGLLLEDSTYLRCMCGTFSALLNIAETPGTVELRNLDVRRRRAEFEARWGRSTTPRRSG